MKALLAIPIMGLVVIVQSAIFSRINVLAGCPDLVLLVVAGWGLQPNARYGWIWAGLAGLMVGYVSGVNMVVMLIGYLLVMGLAQLVRRLVWQAPLLAMFAVTGLGTLAMLLITYVSLWIQGSQLVLGEVFIQIILPSLLFNLLLSLPVYPVMHDLSLWIHPSEMEV